MAETCPVCGKKACIIKKGTFVMTPPPNIPGGDLKIKNSKWEECEECHERFIAHELDRALDAEVSKRMENGL